MTIQTWVFLSRIDHGVGVIGTLEEESPQRKLGDPSVTVYRRDASRGERPPVPLGGIGGRLMG
jgi:hypothetical protein